MKILFLIIMLLLTACTKNGEISKGEISFEKINSELSPQLVIAEKEITIGEGVTKIIDDGKNRVLNIMLACSSISGTKLSPGEEFSFNNITGRKTAKRGYKYAPIIFEGEKSYGIGGGVCQVSTTIYMAAQNAKLQITERHPHSESVAYAPHNNDATVVYGEKDFKFKNNTDDILYIYTWTEEDNVYAKIVRKDIVLEKKQSQFQINS